MALVDLHYAYITLIDSRKKTTDVRFRVTSTEAAIYFNEVTQILKDATDIGQLLLSVEDLSAGVMVSKGIILETVDDAYTAPTPDANVYHFDKLGVKFEAGLDNYQMTIPSRDDTQYTVADDGVTVITTGAGADPQVTDFIARFNAAVLAKNGGAATVTGMLVVS